MRLSSMFILRFFNFLKAELELDYCEINEVFQLLSHYLSIHIHLYFHLEKIFPK